MATNQFTSTQLELAMAGSASLSGLETFQEEMDPDRIVVTIRLMPSLHKRVKAIAQRDGVSMNRLILFVLHTALAKAS